MRSLDGVGWVTCLLVPRGMELSTGSSDDTRQHYHHSRGARVGL